MSLSILIQSLVLALFVVGIGHNCYQLIVFTAPNSYLDSQWLATTFRATMRSLVLPKTKQQIVYAATSVVSYSAFAYFGLWVLFIGSVVLLVLTHSFILGLMMVRRRQERLAGSFSL